MDPLLISAASGMQARMESLDMLANNIANSGTAGFKADREFYNLYGSEDPLAASALPVIERQWTDFAQGTLLPTGNTLDVAITGKGFFVADTSSGPLYTRNGNFRLSPTGQLLTQDGEQVRVTRPDGKPAVLDRSVPVQINGKGELYQNGQLAGTLAVVDIEDASQLSKLGSTYFKFAGPNPKLAQAAEVHQGSLESANVPTGEAAVRLVGVMRQFEMMQRAVSIGSEMDRRAIEEVAKAGS